MVQVVNRGDVFGVRLACRVCGKRCRRLDELWLAFPPGEAVQGEWVHRSYVDGHARELFGTRRIVMMRGIEALKRLAEALDETADDQGLRRQRAWADVKAKR